MTLKIEQTLSPDGCDVNFLTDQINKDSAKLGVNEKSSAFAFFIRDEDERIVGGCNGFVIYGAIYTDQLWVDRDYRGQGFAKKIMAKVHEFGLLEGCKIATVQTMSFQGAQSFYEKLRYVQDFKRAGYVNGSNCIFMRKAL
mgnify:CR=1 FL=1